MRYTASRKYAIIQQLEMGEKTPGQIMEEHMLSSAELDEWIRLFYHNGIGGLRSTKLQHMDGRKCRSSAYKNKAA